MILAVDDVQQGLGMVVLVLAATTIMLVLLRRRQFRQVTGRDVTREQVARLRDQRSVRTQMDDLLIELEELSRRINAQLDTKFVRLETVVRDADDRIARLEGVLGRPKAPKPKEGNRSEKRNVETAKPAAPADSSQAAGRGREPADASPRAPLNEEQKRVYDMSDAGTDPIQIAESLGMTLGEVELILNLRNFR